MTINIKYHAPCELTEEGQEVFDSWDSQFEGYDTKATPIKEYWSKADNRTIAVLVELKGEMYQAYELVFASGDYIDLPDSNDDGFDWVYRHSVFMAEKLVSHYLPKNTTLRQAVEEAVKVYNGLSPDGEKIGVDYSGGMWLMSEKKGPVPFSFFCDAQTPDKVREGHQQAYRAARRVMLTDFLTQIWAFLNSHVSRQCEEQLIELERVRDTGSKMDLIDTLEKIVDRNIDLGHIDQQIYQVLTSMRGNLNLIVGDFDKHFIR